MAEIINLNRARKRASEEAEAAANREKFGRTKARREAEKTETLKNIRDLDGKKRDDAPDEPSDDGNRT